MASLFLVLFFVSLVGLIVGLINPVIFIRIIKRKVTRKQVGWIFGIAIVIFFVLVAVTTESDETAPRPENEISDVVEPEKIGYTFDIPVLLNKNIKDFSGLFGKAVSETPEPTDIAIEAGFEDWTQTFEKSNHTIAVNYHIASGRVINIFLSKGGYYTPIEQTQITEGEKNDLLQVGNLSVSSNQYTVSFNRSVQDRNKYTGAVVIKK